jgi:uncharacterized protein (DUF433 family)
VEVLWRKLGRRGKSASKGSVVSSAAPVVGVGLYSVSEAGRLLSQQIGARQGRQKLKRWGFGYWYPYGQEKRKSWPLVKDGGPNLAGCDLFTFAQLIELLVMGAFRNEGVSMQVIRAAHKQAQKEFKTSHPFVLRRFDTDGSKIFARLTPDDVGDHITPDDLTVELTRCQVVMDKVVRPFFRNIDYVKDIASRLWPMGQDRTVVIDPERAFGKPINNQTGVPTAVLYAMHHGGSSEPVIADWYEVPLQGVKDAIEYEGALRASG